jgi:hypothetical protein
LAESWLERRMVKVYQARVLSAERVEMTKTAHKGTLEWIAMLPVGEALPETEEDVSESNIDGQGRYIPKLEAQRASRS